MSTNTGVHTCSYYCERPECVRRQRDELRDRMEAALAALEAAREPDYWTYITNDQYRAFSPVKPPDNAYAEGTLEPLYAAHPAITHCDNCGCDWLDNGLNPVGCPYCKQSEQETKIAALRAEVERLSRILGRIVKGDGDSTLAIRVGTDAFAAAREYLRPNTVLAAQQQGGRTDG